MAKRFTDTEKWKKPFIRNLQGAYKLLWVYICDDCDHSGIWQVDIEIASIRIGEKIDEKEAIAAFGNKIVLLADGSKWFIPSFIEFQYPSGLNPENKAHGGIIKALNKFNLIDDEFNLLTSPLQGDKDKVMDKEQVMVKEMVIVEKPIKKAEPKKQTHLFRDSPIFDKTVFTQSLWGTQYETANIDYYHETILNWSDSKGERKLDWLAAAKGWMGRDMKDNKFVDKNFNPRAQNGKQSITSRAQPGQDELINRIQSGLSEFNEDELRDLGFAQNG